MSTSRGSHVADAGSTTPTTSPGRRRRGLRGPPVVVGCAPAREAASPTRRWPRSGEGLLQERPTRTRHARDSTLLACRCRPHDPGVSQVTRMARCWPAVRRVDIRRAVATAGALVDARARAPRHAVQHVAAVLDCRGAHDASVAAVRSADLPPGHAGPRLLGRGPAAGAPRDAAARRRRADPAGQQRDPAARPVAVCAGDVPARAGSPRGSAGECGSRESGVGTRESGQIGIGVGQSGQVGHRYPAPGTRPVQAVLARSSSPGRSSRCCRTASST